MGSAPAEATITTTPDRTGVASRRPTRLVPLSVRPRDAPSCRKHLEHRSDRPLYAKLLEKLNDGDRLMVWKVDRLGRSTFDALQTAKALDARGVSIVITTLGIDLKTPSG
jgi:hypothetical protein